MVRGGVGSMSEEWAVLRCKEDGRAEFEDRGGPSKGKGPRVMHGHPIEARLAMEAGRPRPSISDLERHAGLAIPEEPRLGLAGNLQPPEAVPSYMGGNRAAP